MNDNLGTDDVERAAWAAAIKAERDEVTRLAVLVEAKIVENIWLEAHVASVRAAVVALGDAANGESFAAQADGNLAQARDWAVRGGVYRKVMNLLDAAEGKAPEGGGT